MMKSGSQEVALVLEEQETFLLRQEECRPAN
jgi:hypothetical protein